MKRLKILFCILLLTGFLAADGKSPAWGTTVDSSNDRIWAQVTAPDGGFNAFSLFWNITAISDSPELSYTVYWPEGVSGPQYTDPFRIPVGAFTEFYGKALTFEFSIDNPDANDSITFSDDISGDSSVWDSNDPSPFPEKGFLFAFYDVQSPFGDSEWANRSLVGSGGGDWTFTDPNDYDGIFYQQTGISVTEGPKRSDLTPVPEPGTWALLAAGLGILGVIRRYTPSRTVRTASHRAPHMSRPGPGAVRGSPPR